MAERRRSATITAVAAHAGVSASTVSRVMNGRTNVDPTIAERVRSSAAELGYSASPLARSLVLGKTMTVAVLVPDLANPTFQNILRGVSRAAARDGYRVLIADSAEDSDEEPILASEMRRRTDGIVLCSPRMPETALRPLLEELRPVVLINRESPAVEVPVLMSDYENGIKLLAKHLYDLGHRRLVYLGGNTDSMSNVQRLEGLAAFGVRHPDVEIRTIPAGSMADAGRDAADAVLASGATGVLAFNDLVAMGLLSELAERGIAVPQEISVAGFDDIPFARLTSPSLTSASIPLVEVGAQAWRRLRTSIEGGRAEPDISFRPTVRTRTSTAAPAR